MYTISVPSPTRTLPKLLISCTRQPPCRSGKAFLRRAGPLDVAVVDEAAQLVEAEALVLLHAQPGLRKLVMVRAWVRYEPRT